MKKIQINYLKLENFKGIKDLEVAFAPDLTVISGQNATGKTTIADAFSWVLFNSDTANRSDFKVQTHIDGELVPEIETKVELMLTEFSGSNELQHTFTRVVRQKWVKDKGTKELSFRGIESVYFYNDVPLNLSDYNKKIDEVCERSILRLLTSVTAFCSLSTKERRSVIDQVAGIENVDNELLASDAYAMLRQKIAERKTLQEVKTEVSAKIRKLKDELKAIPTRRDEAYRSLPAEMPNFDAIRKEQAEVDRNITRLEEELMGVGKNAANEEIIKEVSRVRNDMFEVVEGLRTDLQNKKDDLQNKLTKIQRESSQLKMFMDDSSKKVEENEPLAKKCEERLMQLGQRWDELNRQSPEELPEKCECCGHVFTPQERAEKGAELVKAFNVRRQKEYDSIEAEGNTTHKLMQSYIDANNTLRQEVAKSLTELQKLQKEEIETQVALNNLPTLAALTEASKEHTFLQNKLAELNGKITAPELTGADQVRIDKKTELKARYRELVEALAKEGQYNAINQRISDIDEQEKQFAEELSKQEEILIELSEFEREKADLITERVNSLFQIVTFRLYEQNVTNDSEKIMCECLVDGIPYSTNLNMGAKINAGLDICIALQRHYRVIAPIWIDNMESVSDITVNNDINAQLAVLRVVPDLQLTIA